MTTLHERPAMNRALITILAAILAALGIWAMANETPGTKEVR